MAKTKRAESIDRAAGAASVVGLDEIIELLNSPKRLGLLKFYTGLMAGIGGVLGAALIILALGFLIKIFGGVPWIGDLLHNIGSAAHSTSN